jgi:hypothetical protein
MMMKIELPENYTIELEMAKTNCFGRIFHPNIHHHLTKIGFFVASITEEDQTFNKHLMIDLCLENGLKFDSEKNISVDATNPQGFAGPYDKELLKKLLEYQKSDLPPYSRKLPNYIVDAIRRNFLGTLYIPIGISLWEVAGGQMLEFLEHGSLWK